MTRAEFSPIRLHEDQELFRGLILSTAQSTGFSSWLVEKDYYCSLLLQYFAAEDASLVFKGGTCLAKVHAGFYRLSEDLDFSIPLPHETSRSKRREAAETLKQAVNSLPDRLSVFHIIDPWRGSNHSAQYAAIVGYHSLVLGTVDTIKIEAGLREPLLKPPIVGAAQTLLMDPSNEQPLLDSISIHCLSKAEAYAEKFRAALSRREAAIRDFYDLDHAVRKLGIRANDSELFDLVRMKLMIPGNDAVDVSEARLAVLRGQVESQLRPVLREVEFNQFDLDRAFEIVAHMAGMIR